MDTSLGAKGLIINEKEILVLIEPDGKLDFPGGRVKCGETHREALIRETVEETGLTVCIQEPAFEWSFFKRSGRLIAGITYLCLYIGGQVRLSHEHSSCYWSTLDRIDHPDLRRWFDPHGQPAFSFNQSLATEAVTIK